MIKNTREMGLKKEQEEQGGIGAIIRELMGVHGVNEAELARQTGLPQPTVHRIITSESRDPRMGTLQPIARFFSVTISQLLGEEPIEGIVFAGYKHLLGRNAWVSIPIIEWEDVEMWLFRKHEFNPGTHYEWVTVERGRGENTFCLRTRAFMSPLFKKDSVVIVDSDEGIEDGKYAVVLLKENTEPTVRKIIKEGGDVFLEAFSRGIPTEKLTSEKRILGIIIESRLKY